MSGKCIECFVWTMRRLCIACFARRFRQPAAVHAHKCIRRVGLLYGKTVHRREGPPCFRAKPIAVCTLDPRPPTPIRCTHMAGIYQSEHMGVTRSRVSSFSPRSPKQTAGGIERGHRAAMERLQQIHGHLTAEPAGACNDGADCALGKTRLTQSIGFFGKNASAKVPILDEYDCEYFFHGGRRGIRGVSCSSRFACAQTLSLAAAAPVR